MKTVDSDIGHAAEIHRLLVEAIRDIGPVAKVVGIQEPTLDFWLHAYSETNFFCLYMKHGKKPVGFIMGKLKPFYKEPEAEISLIFIRRGFRQFKFKRGLLVALRAHLLQNKIKRVSAVENRSIQTRLLRGE